MTFSGFTQWISTGGYNNKESLDSSKIHKLSLKIVLSSNTGCMQQILCGIFIT